MSWLADSTLNPFQRLCVNVLKCGPIPRHVAFILDGNRRYATKSNLQKIEGHSRGFEKLAETLRWCLELGISEVTVYTFSIENFKRSQEEVDALMALAEEKFQNLLDEEAKIMKEGVCVRVIGNFAYLSPKLRALIAKAVLMTKHNSRAFLNVAFSYTARDEMASCVQTLADGVRDGRITAEDITEDLFSRLLYTNRSPEPGILIRTSGEVRLSDFLLWQVSGSQIHVSNVLWPEFSFWNLLVCIFKYQRNYCTLKMYQDMKKTGADGSQRTRDFVQFVQEQRLERLKSYLVQ